MEKYYAVEVLEKYSHGHFGKKFYFGMYVLANNKKQAEADAMELVGNMTVEEFLDRCVDDINENEKDNLRKLFKGKDISIEEAYEHFSYRAYIE